MEKNRKFLYNRENDVVSRDTKGRSEPGGSGLLDRVSRKWVPFYCSLPKSFLPVYRCSSRKTHRGLFSKVYEYVQIHVLELDVTGGTDTVPLVSLVIILDQGRRLSGGSSTYHGISVNY